ncbi:MAG: DUF1727 domain-containing protein [Lachnospiraceae bacterium]|nr:DUF1727 domain-containing protein [Lachnospiraceae bacterium]
MRFWIALYMAKLCEVLMKLVGRFFGFKGTCFPGKLALKICPDFLGRLAKPVKLIAVTGTDGKTTTCNLLIEGLQKCGMKVLANQTGTNILPGVAVAFMDGVTLGNKCKYEVGVIEIDERSAPHVFPRLRPTYLVVTNLFRDSLKRNAHPEFIFNILENSLPKDRKPEDMTIITNGDDVISSRLGEGFRRVCFGIDRMEGDTDHCQNIINDARICPCCHHPLTYDWVRYHHIGRAHCDHCGFKLPDIDYRAVQVDMDNMTMTVLHGGEETKVKLISNTVFNIYNQLTMMTVLHEITGSMEKVNTALESMKVTKARMTDRVVAGRKLITCVAKDSNAIACSLVFKYTAGEPGRKEVMLNIDEIFDNRDSYEILSWMYDCDFEFLNHPSIEKIIIGGKRCRDVRFRLLLAGVPEDRMTVCDREEDVWQYLSYAPGVDIYLLHDMYFISQAQADSIVAHVTEKLEGGTKA